MPKKRAQRCDAANLNAQRSLSIYVGYEIAGESVSGDQAVVRVRFCNEPYNVTWTDEVVLVDEGRWKIDDIRYAQKMAGMLSLREVLREFERAVAAEAAIMAKQQ